MLDIDHLRSEISSRKGENLNKIISRNILIVLRYLENHSVTDLYTSLFFDNDLGDVSPKYFANVVYRAKKRYLDHQEDLTLDLDKHRIDKINAVFDQKIANIQAETENFLKTLEVNTENQIKRIKQAHIEDFSEKIIKYTDNLKKPLYDDLINDFEKLSIEVKEQLEQIPKKEPVKSRLKPKPVVISGAVTFFIALLLCFSGYKIFLKPKIQNETTSQVLRALDKTLNQPEYKKINQEKFYQDLDKNNQ